MSLWTQFAGGGVKSIQRGTISLADGVDTSATATVSSVDTAKSELRFLGARASVANNFSPPALTLTNATTVTATRNSSVATVVVSWELTEFF